MDISWEDEPDQTIVCYCQRVEKATIVDAIQQGASDINCIGQMTSAGMGSNCTKTNPRQRCCHQDIAQLLRLYGNSSQALLNNSQDPE